MAESKNKILVNGPVVCFRLEGYVNSVKKVIYLFGDNHSSTSDQTKCPTHKSRDFVQYFAKTMSKTNKKTNYDLFFETHEPNKETSGDNDIRKDKYIHEFVKYFKSTINIVNKDDKNDKNDNKTKSKNIGSKEEPNLRLHHIDTRTSYTYLISSVVSELRYFKNNIIGNQHIDKYSAEQMVYFLNKLKIYTQNTLSFILNEDFVKDDSNENNDNIKQLYLIDKTIAKKVLGEYHNQNIKNILINETKIINIVRMYKENLLKECDKLNEIVERHYNIFQSSYKKISVSKSGVGYGMDFSYIMNSILEISESVDIICNCALMSHTFVMDMYFLRRFLDKDYITNTIAYTGWLHTFHYLFMLIKYFDFKITHTSHLEMKPNEIEKMIKNNEYSNYLVAKYMPAELFQCVDMTDFPERFE